MANHKRRETYHCLNITILNTKDNPPEKYIEIFKQLRDLQAVKVRGNDCLKIRTIAETKLENENFLTGQVTKYTKLESEQWYDEVQNKGTTVDVPDNVHPNMVETKYYFWPKKHKLFLKKSYESGSPTLNQMVKYLNVIFENKFDQEINVSIVQSHDSIERIINAKEIFSLNFEVSYTNADSDTEAEVLIDDLYKGAKASKINTKLRSTSDNKINGSSDFVKGNLSLARKTGNAEARIEDEAGIKHIVKTENYPASVKARETEEEPFNRTLLKMFQNLLS